MKQTLHRPQEKSTLPTPCSLTPSLRTEMSLRRWRLPAWGTWSRPPGGMKCGVPHGSPAMCVSRCPLKTYFVLHLSEPPGALREGATVLMWQMMKLRLETCPRSHSLRVVQRPSHGGMMHTCGPGNGTVTLAFSRASGLMPCLILKGELFPQPG